MKKIWLLTSLLVAGLLLTGCHNPLKDIFNPIEWKSYTDVPQICENNDWEITTDELWNDICLFNALDWCLLEKIQNWTCEFLKQCEWDDCNIPDDFEGCNNYFDWCNRCTLQDDWEIICTEEACGEYQEAYCADEPVVKESEISLIDQLKQSFTWNLINWKVDESLLTNKPNNIYFDITWDSTLYYIDEFWLAFTLWKEWEWWKIENAYEWKYLASVRIRNEWIKSYWILIIDNTTYQRIKDSLSNDEDETIWYNNQYTFQRRIVDNWDKLWEYNLVLYEVDNEKYNLYNQSLEDIKSKAQPQRINDYPEKISEEENVLIISEENMNTDNVISLKIWDKTFDVILEDNTATKALYERLKEWYVVINAKEYWGFEKVWDLGFDLPREDKQIRTEAWDIVLYNWNQISLFYDSNSRSYTKLWKIQNTSQSELKEVLWDWNVTLTFSLDTFKIVEETNKSLILVFSPTGNTKRIATFIDEITESDLVELIPEIPYTSDDLNYNTDCRANREQNDDTARPWLATEVNLDGYDRIYLGYPIWWWTNPKLILTLIEKYDFSGKEVVLFCTSGSSWIWTSETALKWKGLNVIWSKRFSASSSKQEVEDWLNSL